MRAAPRRPSASGSEAGRRSRRAPPDRGNFGERATPALMLRTSDAAHGVDRGDASCIFVQPSAPRRAAPHGPRPQARHPRRRRQVRRLLRLQRHAQAQLARRQGHRLDRGHGHLPQLRAGRPLHLAAEDPAHQLLHLRLPLLRQPRRRATCRARASRSTRWCSSRSTSTAATTSRACSSARGIIRTPDYTMEQLVEVARVLREEHDFRGYIHLKTIPDAERRAARARPAATPTG